MEKLPNELILKIFKQLSLRDCCRLGSTCVKMYDLLPSAIAGLEIKELITEEIDDFPPVAFIERNLASQITLLRANVQQLDKDLSRLKDILAALKNLRVLCLTGGDELFLNDVLSSVAVKELHVGLSRIIIPLGVEKCTTIESSLQSTYAIDLQRVARGHPELQTSLSTIESLHLQFYDKKSRVDWSKMLDILATMPRLFELSLSRSTIPEASFFSGTKPIRNVKTLTLDLPLDFGGLQAKLLSFPAVENLHLDVSQMITSNPADLARHRNGTIWPKSLKQLYLFGYVPSPSHWTVGESRGQWQNFFGEVKSHQSLLGIHQDFQFFHDDAKRYKEFMLPSMVPNHYKENMRLFALFKDLYLWVRGKEDWRDIVAILRSHPGIDHLYLSLDEVDRNSNEVSDVGCLPVASPTIKTRIQHVTINFMNHPRQATLGLLSSFNNVNEWSFVCAPIKPLLTTSLVPSFTGRLTVTYTGATSLDELLMDFSSISHLTINNLTKTPIDLLRLWFILQKGSNLKSLDIVGSFLVSHEDCEFDSCTVTVSQLAICFRFPKLERVCFREICPNELHHYVRELEDMKSFSAWPPRLKEIVVHQNSNCDGGEYVRVVNFGLGVKIYCSALTFGVDQRFRRDALVAHRWLQNRFKIDEDGVIINVT